MLNFNKIILHNFGSYGHAVVELSNKGICLVSGRNNYKKDNAFSNGSGKSFLWSGICFALTGETISGLKSNLKNINVEDDPTSFVTVELNNDADNYIITRHIAPKSDLKVIKNGVDISGKGLRESEKKLSEVLPDLTKDLIASTIIIGQGMPNKFSAFSPSGRKELLEKLTKSDFMVEDIKQRVSNRQAQLNTQLRTYEDILLVNNTQLSTSQKLFETKTIEFEKANKPDFETKIQEITLQLAQLNIELDETITQSKDITTTIDLKSEEMFKLMNLKASELEVEKNAYEEAFRQYYKDKAELEAKVGALMKEISQLKAIKDTCPTCGQKIPGAVKPDCSQQELQLEQTNAALAVLNSKITDCTSKHLEYQAEISSKYDSILSNLKVELDNLKNELTKYKTTESNTMQYLNLEKEKLAKLNYEKENWDRYYSDLKQVLATTEQEIKNLNSVIQTATANKQDVLEHLAVIKKMDSLIKRDFRGYLLTNIIKYLDQKAKDYSEIVFNTRELDIYLDGNALDIAYSKKMFDNLSGGEKQRVDLILQFAIRNMLNAYLNSGSNILVLDEITDFLDKQSCAAVMRLIEKELVNIESVFVVSHHATELDLPVDSELKIVKNEFGISEIL